MQIMAILTLRLAVRSLSHDVFVLSKGKCFLKYSTFAELNTIIYHFKLVLDLDLNLKIGRNI